MNEKLKTLLITADENNNIGNYAEAERLAQHVLSELRSQTDDGVTQLEDSELYCNALLTLSSSNYRRGEYHQPLNLAHSALEIAERCNFPVLIAKALGIIGLVYLHLSDYVNALEYLKRALVIDQELGNKIAIAHKFGNIGIVYSQLSDYANALEYYQKSLSIYEEIGNKHGISGSLGNIGLIYQQLSDYAKALEYYQKSLYICEELGNKSGIASNLGNIGLVYADLSDYAKALEYYEKSLAINEEFGRKSSIAIILGNIGLVYKNLLDFAKALEYHQKALVIHEDIGNRSGVAINLGNIGNIYGALLDFTQALENYQRALNINVELGRKDAAAINLANIGILYANEQYQGYDLVKAEEYLLKARAMNEELGTKWQNASDFRSLADLYEKQGRWKEHSYHFKKFFELQKEVQSEEATKQAQLMEYRRKIEESERDRQIKLVRFQEQEKILHNILPSHIAERMVAGEKTIADTHENVSIFFSDIVGFTKLSQQISAVELVGMLSGLFTQFDRIARKYGLEKIKTIGDSYMAVASAPIKQENHAERAALFALDVAELMKNYHTPSGEKMEVRIGLHSGSVVAGVIGENKFAYDLWGDAVNTASRMESHGEAGKIHVSEDFARNLTETLSKREGFSSFTFPIGEGRDGVLIERGEMEIKGKGIMKTYFLEK
jgi:class 3 adenylate cyclase/tetratricopeptide (TPR) repeat protein